MKRLALLTLAFAILSAVFFLLLIFFRTPFVFYPLMSYQDALDVLTPLVLIPIYWVLFKLGSNKSPSLKQELVFMVFAAIWVLGQGMHLSANSVNNLSEALAEQGSLNILKSAIYQLTYFYDEHLSHYLWHIGVLGLAVVLIFREWRAPAGEKTNWGIAIVGGIIYGFNNFCIFNEGQTVPLGFPVAVLLTLGIAILGRKKLAQQPILAFFFISFLVTSLILTGWWIRFGEFIQFSEAGLM